MREDKPLKVWGTYNPKRTDDLSDDDTKLLLNFDGAGDYVDTSDCNEWYIDEASTVHCGCGKQIKLMPCADVKHFNYKGECCGNTLYVGKILNKLED